ncbi:MAG TPA: hypothetical protein VK360_06820 [Acidimicrobiales bacterium]|nr:hypothetical protein [Acidimicrobiales bacterium]
MLTREYWRTEVVPADAHGWAWLGGFMPERALVARYRATFFYGLCRVVSWSTWAHAVARPVIDGVEHIGYPLDLSWTGPWWIGSQPLPHVSPWLVPLGVGVPLAPRLPGGQQALGADGPGRGGRPRPSRLRRRRRRLGRPGVGAADDVGAEDLHRVEVEAPHEGHGSHVARYRVGRRDEPQIGKQPMRRLLERGRGHGDLAGHDLAWDEQFAHTRPAR